jgi:hypothetical protein
MLHDLPLNSVCISKGIIFDDEPLTKTLIFSRSTALLQNFSHPSTLGGASVPEIPLLIAQSLLAEIPLSVHLQNLYIRNFRYVF